MRTIRYLLLITVGLWACDDAHDHDHDHGSTEAEAAIEAGCQHFEFGPHHPDFMAAAAGEAAPAAQVHTHYTVALPAGGGRLALTAAAGMYYVMLSRADVQVTVTDAAGAAVAAQDASAPGDACPAAALVHTFMLAAGDFTIELAGEGSVELVIHTTAGAHSHGTDAGHMHGADAGADAGHMHGADAGADAGHMHGG
ncbi:MAG: hypothetical protein R3F43_28675 [bacterium]